MKPLRQKNTSLAQDFDSFFATQIRDKVSFTESVFRKAAEIRADQSFATPDALHLAAAMEGACDLFLTNDAALAGFSGIAVQVVS